MVTFTCKNESCPSKDIENNFLGNPKVALCGGCSNPIEATNERPDPEIPAEQE
jgi:hypothetical protein